MVDVQFIRFCAIGCVGFVTDSVLLLLLVEQFGFAPLPARLGSFLAASIVTYILNGRFTFRRRTASVRQWFVYVLVTGLGALVNVGLYHAWVALTGTTAVNLITGVALGSIVALSLNYSVSRKLVFRV